MVLVMVLGVVVVAIVVVWRVHIGDGAAAAFAAHCQLQQLWTLMRAIG